LSVLSGGRHAIGHGFFFGEMYLLIPGFGWLSLRTDTSEIWWGRGEVNLITLAWTLEPGGVAASHNASCNQRRDFLFGGVHALDVVGLRCGGLSCGER
jgi:hypothetical protein